MISILIPCKNAENYLPECLSSIIAQSYNDWEIIAINDHSQDLTEQILRSYAAIDPRIKVYNNTGKGIIDSLKIALQKSEGQMITRMDADDIMGVHRLEIMSKQLKESGTGYISTGKVEYFSNTKCIGNGYIKYQEWLNNLSINGNNFKEIYKECVIPSPCWMVFKSDLMLIGAFDSPIYPEDYDLVFRMYDRKLKVIPTSDEILLKWRDHHSRSSRTDPNYSDNRFLELKVKYFIQIDYKTDIPLFVWGAGKKGKILAQMLLNKEIPFHWITENAQKIGRDIYGIQLTSPTILETYSSGQIIVMVANPIEQNEIKTFIHSKNKTKDIEQYWFC